MPKISIITINYDNAVGLEKTIKSVISQTYQDFEYIVIDGGSKDGGRQVIEKYSNQIDYWVTEPDNGIYNAMNKGIIRANGEYLIFINSGDELYENTTMEKCAPSLENADIISGNLKIVDHEQESIFMTPDSISLKLFIEGTLVHPSTFIKKKAFEQTELYDENLTIISDWKWFMLGLFKYNLSHKSIDDIVSIFYKDGISSLKENQAGMKIEKLKVLNATFPYLLSEYEDMTRRLILLEGYQTSRIIRLLKKIGFLNGL